MTGSDFKDERRTAGLRTRRQTADFFGVSEQTIYRWETGGTAVPAYAPMLLESRVAGRFMESTISSIRRASAEGIPGLIRAAYRGMRLRQNLTQQDVERRAHISRSWVVHFEAHDLAPSSQFFASALEALRLDTAELLAGVPVLGDSLAKLDDGSCRQLLAILLASGFVNAPANFVEQRPKRRTVDPVVAGQRGLFDPIAATTDEQVEL